MDIRELLDDGERLGRPLTGTALAEIFGCSDSNARRLLRQHRGPSDG
jgi:MarR-like DNA-binding transcriptional regulator SgrR of sgrS sRNA